MNQELPRILSPDLGSSIIISPADLESKGFDVVIAEESDHRTIQVFIKANPSFDGEGKEFFLELSEET